MLRKIVSVAVLTALLLSLCGCCAKANTTYTGTVTAISADSVTLETDDGKVTIKLTANTQFTMGGFGGFGQIPEGGWPADGQRPERGEKPDGNFEKTEGNFEKPEGNFEKPEGDFQFPEGQMPSFEGGEMPDFSQFPEGEMPEGMPRPEDGSFEGFSGFSGMNYSSIPVGTSVTVTTGADKTAASISLSMNFQNFGGQIPNFQN